MKARFLPWPAGTFRRLAREESGVALMMTLAVFLLLYILCCGVYATGEIIRQKQELQNACDAAAYSAAVVQADALSRMAVVNRAMAWSYIQLSREQMDYIVFSWLKLTCERFHDDYTNKVAPGGITDKRHYQFEDWKFGIFGFNDRHGWHDNAYYCGVTTPSARKDDHVSLNWRTGLAEAVAVKEIEESLERIGGNGWKEGMEKGMEDLKEAIGAMNLALWGINDNMHQSIKETVQYVLYQNLPKDADGNVREDLAQDYHWTLSGGMGNGPEAYAANGLAPLAESDSSGSYFDAMYNTEEDEIKFLTMADGIPGGAGDAPGWMKGRPVLLSDYFGIGAHPVEPDGSPNRYLAGGLDQWYVRGTDEEAASGELSVEKGVRDPPAGIQRVYKHSNRDEGKTLGVYHRPNHVFQLGLNAEGLDLKGITETFNSFADPSKLIQKAIDDLAQAVYKKVYRFYRNLGFSRRRSRRWANAQADLIRASGNMSPGELTGVYGDIGGMLGQLTGGGLGQLMNALKTIANGDIPPSNEHSLARYPDQCHNVSERTGLVSQYEWASAYWFCPWVCIPPFIDTDFPHIPIPVSAILGCEHHGYDNWLVTQLKVILEDFGATRNDYESCFINFDPTVDKNKNTLLRGYARIYGDDKDIWNETGYIGAVACPWVLRESFFAGDGTILVGLARKQRNPFLGLLAKGASVDRPSLYEPFSPQPGADRFLVAFSAARAAWAPRPEDAATGMETVNDGHAPGKYDIRFDAATDELPIVDNEFKPARMGCVCGNRETQERLLRMWNLSQTDWDATLLPLRHAFCGYLPRYDSTVNAGLPFVWDYRDTEINAVVGLAGRLGMLEWGCMGEASSRMSSDDILAVPEATEEDSGARGSLYEMLLYRRLL
ncbi:MAG: hypothetical protein IK066_11535 [Kiritimatiellae bacterium]|nr:hypothetical protein [Kiritimatiellia bacterium]